MTPREIDKLLIETGFDPKTMGDHRRYSTAVVQWKKLIPVLVELRELRKVQQRPSAIMMRAMMAPPPGVKAARPRKPKAKP